MNNAKVITIVYNTAVYIYKFRVNLIKRLQERGFTVVLLCPYDEYVGKLEALGAVYHPIRMSQYGMNPFQDLVTIYDIYEAFKKYKPQYSLHYTIKPNIYGGIAARLAGVKVVNNVAGAGKAFANADSLFTKFITFLFRMGLKRSHKVFFQNFDDMNLFIERKIVTQQQSRRIPGSGVDINRFSCTPHAQEEIRFLFVGRLLLEKGITYYLDAAASVCERHDHVFFDLVGEHEEGKDYIPLQTLEKHLKNAQIRYYGKVSPDVMPDIIGKCACVVLPSFYREGVPRSLLEAAAMCKPIITTDNVGCREVVDEGVNGYKCPIKDAACLSRKMMDFIALSQEERTQMGANGRAKIEREFDETFVLDAYMATIQ